MAYGPKKMYLKDYVSKAPGQELEVQVTDKAPGLVQKESRAGEVFYLQNFSFRIVATGQEITEGFFPKTKSGKSNITVDFLSAVPTGGTCIAYMNGEYLNFKYSDDNQDRGYAEQPPPPQQHAPQPPSRPAPPPPPRPPQMSPVPTEHEYVLALHGIVQAQLSAGVEDWVIKGDFVQPEGDTRPMSAQQWVEWIGNKAHGMVLEYAVKNL